MSIQKKNFSEIIQFTRASGGTSFRPVGRGTLVNRLLWSGDFRYAAWLGGGNGKPTFIASQVTDPFGGNSAYSCAVATDGWQAGQDVAVASTPMTMAVWARTTTGTSTALGLLLNNDQLFLRPTVTTEWQLFVVSGTVGALSGSGRCGILVDTNSTLLVSRAAVFSGIFTAQQIIDNGGLPITFSAPDNVVRIDNAGDPIQLFQVPANYPRRDYDPVTGACKGLLVEEQRTNLITYSNDFENAAWSKLNSSVTSNVTVAPDGTLTADKLVEAATNAQHRILLAPATTSGAIYTNSIYLKAAGRSWAYLAESNYVSAGVYVNLTTGVLGSVVGTGSPSASIVNAGNGWFRVTLTYTAGGTSSRVSAMSATGDGGDAYLGDGVSGIYVWGAQMELGAFPTSYIPTSGAAATRAADVPVVNTLAPWYNTAEGTLLMDIGGSKPSGVALSATASLVGSNVATTYIIPCVGVTTVGVVVSGGGGNISSGVTVAGQAVKMALGMSPASQSLIVNGGSPITRTAAAPLDLITALRVGCYESNPGALNGHIRRIQYIPKRLSDAKLQALTT